MATYYVPRTALETLLREREGVSTFAPTETEALAWLDCADPEKSIAPLAQPRPAQSFKGFFLAASESVGRYGSQAAAPTAVQVRQLVLVGVRACELRARNYLDKVLLEGDFDDPAYRAQRDATTTVSCDCVDCTDSCFCTLVGGRPFATEGYDANLSPVDDGFVLEVATEAGRKWVAEAVKAKATEEQLARRDEIRQAMVRRLEEQNAKFGLSASDTDVPALPDDAATSWQKFAADCVECGACTNICPTCHCFYLYDQALGPEQFERVRTWDSCLLSTYHRMAGAAGMKGTPRPNLSSRLANRVLHKFTYSPQQYELLGCVGCGRCIDACLGEIDIREVVEELGK